MQLAQAMVQPTCRCPGDPESDRWALLPKRALNETELCEELPKALGVWGREKEVSYLYSPEISKPSVLLVHRVSCTPQQTIQIPAFPWLLVWESQSWVRTRYWILSFPKLPTWLDFSPSNRHFTVSGWNIL